MTTMREARADVERLSAAIRVAIEQGATRTMVRSLEDDLRRARLHERRQRDWLHPERSTWGRNWINGRPA